MGGNDESPYIDNDGLAAYIAETLQTDLMVLMSDVDGIYTGPIDAQDTRLLHTFCPDVHTPLFNFPEEPDFLRTGTSTWASSHATLRTGVRGREVRSRRRGVRR
jgi:delta-1-pyrroline-5-carboxylate synthetase